MFFLHCLISILMPFRSHGFTGADEGLCCKYIHIPPDSGVYLHCQWMSGVCYYGLDVHHSVAFLKRLVSKDCNPSCLFTLVP